MGKIVLEANEIYKSYANGTNKLNVLKNFTIKVHQGDIITIVGESGCGKSTALNIMSTLDQPDKGKVKIDSLDISRLDDTNLSKIRNQKIGFVFQSHYLLPEFTALENAIMPAWIANKDNKKSAVENIFEYLGILKRKNHYPSQLSGGEKARVCLTRAIINEPLILFADEPTGNLDKKNSEKLVSLFQKINSDFNQTIILTTHNKEVADFGNKKLILENGVLT